MIDFGERVGPFTKETVDGSVVSITVRFNTGGLRGFFEKPWFFINVSQSFPDYGATARDVFYSLDESGQRFWHIEDTPFMGSVTTATDNSLARLLPYKEEVLAILPPSKARTLLERGFQNSVASTIQHRLS